MSGELSFKRLKRALAFALAVTSALFGAAQRSDSQQSFPLRLGVTTSTSQTMAHNAIDAGIYKKYGIDASLIVGQSGTALTAAMVGGSIDLVQTPYTSAAQAVQGGVDLVLVSPNNSLVAHKLPNGQYKGNSEVIVKASSGITKAADLKGKTFATSSLNDSNSVIAKVWLKDNGVDPSTVRFVAVSFVAMEEAVVAGQVDAAFIAEPFQTKALKNPQIRAIDDPFGWVDPFFPSGGWVALRSWAEKHRDVVRQFQRAQVEAAKAGNALTPEQKTKELQEYYHIDPSIGVDVSLGRYDTSFPMANIQRQLDIMAQYGVIDKPIKASSLIFKP